MFRCLVFVIALLLVACEKVDERTLTSEKSHAPIHYSLIEITSKVNKLDGQEVSVQGYLTSFGPILVLVENESSNPFNSPALLVSDPALWSELYDTGEFVDLARFFDSQGCVGKYVEIVGEIGLIEEQNTNGVARIETISTYGSDAFSGDKKLCFSEL